MKRRFMKTKRTLTKKEADDANEEEDEDETTEEDSDGTEEGAADSTEDAGESSESEGDDDSEADGGDADSDGDGESEFDTQLIGNRTVAVAKDLPDAWQKLGAEFGYNPLDISSARVALLGLKKEGKTHFVASIPNSLILDFEDAVGNVVGGNAHRIRILTAKDLKKVLERLKDDALRNRRQFKRITFDTIGRMQSIVKAWLSTEKGRDIDEYKGGRGGKDLVNQRLAGILRDLYAWGYAWTAVFHWRWISGQTDSGEQYQFLKAECQPGAFEGITQDADYLMQIGSEWVAPEVTTKVKGRMVTTKAKKERRFILTTRDGDARGMNDGLGTRVPLPEFMEVPKSNAWNGVVLPAWKEAVAEGKREDAAARKGK